MLLMTCNQSNLQQHCPTSKIELYRILKLKANVQCLLLHFSSLFEAEMDLENVQLHKSIFLYTDWKVIFNCNKIKFHISYCFIIHFQMLKHDFKINSLDLYFFIYVFSLKASLSPNKLQHIFNVLIFYYTNSDPGLKKIK